MIAVVGGYGMGLTMTVPRFPAAGETVSGGRLSTGHGGKGSNQAVAIRRLGQPSALFTAIGSDAAGTAALGFWAEEDVDASAVVRSAAATMTGFILVDPSGENRITIADGALGALTADDVDGFAATIALASMLVLSLEVPIPVARRATSVARSAGVSVLLNPAPANGDAELAALADILSPNQSELCQLVGAPDAGVEECLDKLRAWYPGRVVVTCGAAGAVVDDGSTRERVPAVPVDAVVDTTGAGDAFTAGLAVALVEGATLVEAARFAAAVGAHVVTISEVIPALPFRDDVERIRA
ncbi:ribokinase [soil metagenome]